MINVYKLKYDSKEAALIDLISKEVINNEGNYINGTESVVECGIITITRAVYENEIELTPAVFADGYHYDIMTNDTIVFKNEIFVNNPKYKFA